MSGRRLRNTIIGTVGVLRRVAGLARPGTRIIVLHEVADAALFEQRMQFLQRAYDVVSLGAALEAPGAGRARVAVTFDDGYLDWHDRAVPILIRLGLPATFFVCSGFVGLPHEDAVRFARNRLRRVAAPPPLTPTALRDLSTHSLFEIGSHTATHHSLGGRPDDATLVSEVRRDRERLQDWTQRPVPWFAFPFGGSSDISAPAVDFLRREGFRAAFSGVPEFCRPTSGEFVIGRDSLDVRDPIWLWRARLEGAYDRIYTLRHRPSPQPSTLRSG